MLTSFNHGLRALWRPKWRLTNQLVLANLVAIAVTLGLELWESGGDFDHLEVLGPVLAWSLAFGFGAFVWLTWQGERLLVSDSYRLLPLSTPKLYLGNLLSALGALAYYAVIVGLLLLVAASMEGLWWQAHVHLSSADGLRLVGYGLAGLAWAVAIIVWLWVFITLDHLATEAVSTFIPSTGISRRLIKGVLAVVLVWLLVVILNRLVGLATLIFHHTSGVPAVPLGWDFGGLVLAIVVFGALDLYLLDRWTETQAG